MKVPPNEDRRLHLGFPDYMRRVLFLGVFPAQALRKMGAKVHVVVNDEAEASFAAEEYDSVTTVARFVEAAPFPKGHFDAIVLSGAGTALRLVRDSLDVVHPLLHPDGRLYLLYADEILRREQPRRLLSLAGLDSLLARYDLVRYEPYGQARDVETFPVVGAVNSGYDPVNHAARLVDHERPEWAVSVLDGVPYEKLRDDPLANATASAVRQRAFYDIAARPGTPFRERLRLFFRAQRDFYVPLRLLSPFAPDTFGLLQDVYDRQARFWSLLGNDSMAVRLLNSLNGVTQKPFQILRVADYRPETAPDVPDETAPTWSGRNAPRILLITHDRSDCATDVLFYGLRNLLGDDMVIEYPWKPCLHGQEMAMTGLFPAGFSLPGEPHSLEELCDELRSGRFDLIVFADVVRFRHRDEVRTLLDAAGGLPLFILDTWDDGGINWGLALDYLGRDRADGYFKREMLVGVDYGERAFPMPFAYAECMMPPDAREQPRTQRLFWAGNRIFGQRRLYLECVEAMVGEEFSRSYSQAEYADQLNRSLIGLELFGNAYSTIRSYQLPAHGCMMLAERPLIRVPFAFKDGETAVYFNDLPDLERKLEYCIEHPDEVRRIAAAGRRHFLRHHTATARAGHLLGRIEELLTTP